MKPWKEAEFNIGGAVVRAAVVHGLGNVRKLIAAVERGEAQYDFVEVMACPAAASAAADSRFTMGRSLPKSARLCFTPSTRRNRFVSVTKTRRLTGSMKPIWKSRVPPNHIICCMWSIKSNWKNRPVFGEIQSWAICYTQIRRIASAKRRKASEKLCSSSGFGRQPNVYSNAENSIS